MPVYFLFDYNWEHGELLPSRSKKNKIRTDWGDCLIDPAKCAFPDELVVVVWEMWRGRNGRGTYRVERELYKEHAVSASQVGRKQGLGRVNELELGVICNP